MTAQASISQQATKLAEFEAMLVELMEQINHKYREWITILGSKEGEERQEGQQHAVELEETRQQYEGVQSQVTELEENIRNMEQENEARRQEAWIK